MSSSKRGHWVLLGAALPAVALALAGCEGGGDGSGGAGGAGGGGDTTPVFAISTIVFSPDLSSRTEHIAISDSLDGTGKLDESKAIEIKSENSSIWASPTPGEMFLVDTGTGSLIKYGLGSDGSIEEKSKVSFAAYGVNAFYWTLLTFVSPTKAFLFDEITLKGFIWNPEAMTISKDFDLSSQFNTEEGGMKYTIWRERAPIQIGDRYFAAFKYYDPPSAVSLQRSGMLVMDAANDTFTVVEQPACSGLFNSVLGSDGKIYSATGIVAAAAHFVAQPGATAPCLVRFDPDAMAWDDTFKVDLSALVGPGKFAGGLVSHAGGPVYMRVLLEDQAALLGFTNPLQIAGAPLWEMWKIDDLMNPTAATKMSTPGAGGLLYPFTIDGKTYISDVNLTAGKSWFVDLSVEPPDRALAMPGWGYYAVKMR